MTDSPAPDSAPASAEEQWDARYRESTRIWSGRPNAVLVREVTGTPPGSVLELGCGEGADAVWLARAGWRVTAVDVSGVALDRAAGHAADAGVADRITWCRHDLAETFPTGSYDLVTAHFLHSLGEFPRERILRTAAEHVAPGGALLVVGHAEAPPGSAAAHHDVTFPTAREVLAGLELPDDDWTVERCAADVHPHTAVDGTVTTRTDTVLRVRRRK
jgi:SAM-dependent methyltransferase